MVAVRNSILALGGASLAVIASALLESGPAYAQRGAPEARASVSHAIPFNIASKPLLAALADFTAATRIQVVRPSSRAITGRSVAVRGNFTPASALARLLSASELSFRFTNARTVALWHSADEDGAIPEAPGRSRSVSLDTINVEGQNPLAVLGNLPPPYAGGQVATGGQLGLLGGRGVMDTPFNQTSYTQEMIQNQQAMKLVDVLANDPSIRTSGGRNYEFGTVFIRGFPVGNGSNGFNGLYGLSTSGVFTLLNGIERVEVLKGPGALLDGKVTGSAIGGSINLITKRAGDVPLARLTTSYSSQSTFGAHLDVGRRYGENNEFGIRFNGSYLGGNTAMDGQKETDSAALLGLDYRGDRFRLSADIGYEDVYLNPQTRPTRLGPALNDLPVPPDASSNWMPSWIFSRDRNLIGMVQGELDLTDNITAYAALGGLDSTSRGIAISPLVSNVGGDFTASPSTSGSHDKVISGQAGLRTSFETGMLHHNVNLNYSASDSVGETAAATSGPSFSSNIYNPRTIAAPNLSFNDPVKSSETKLSSYGIVDTMSMFDERLQLTVGVRRQEIETAGFDRVTGARDSSYESAVWSPAYAVLVKPLDGVTLYANYIESLEPGRIVGSDYANAGQVYPPYQSKQYEAGIKVDWGRIITTVSAFQIARPVGVSVPGTPLPSFELDGQTINRGVEVNAYGMLTDNVRVLGGVMFINARLDKTAGGANDGNRTNGVPNVQFNLGAEWDTPFVPGLSLNGRVVHTGETFADNTNLVSVPSWTRWDLGARYTFESPWNQKPITIRFNVENVFNTSYWLSTYNNRAMFMGDPRTYRLSSTFNF